MSKPIMLTKHAVAVYDSHYPIIHRPTWKVIFEYMKANPPDIFIFGGDQFHFDCLSHHTKGKPLYRTQGAYKRDVDGFKRDVLDPLEKLIPKACEKVWIEGNHERFAFDFIEENPELDGLLDHISILRLRELGWQIVPLGHAYKLGKLKVIHGETLSGIGNQAGAFPAKKAVELYAGNVLAGHTHSPQTYTKISPVEHTNKWQGVISPTAGSVNPGYLRNRATAWLNGFVRIDVATNGQFNLYPIIVIDGRAIFNSKIYGRKL